MSTNFTPGGGQGPRGGAHGGRGRGQGDRTFSPRSDSSANDRSGRGRGRGQFQDAPRRGSNAPRAAHRGARGGRGGLGGTIFMGGQPSTVDARIRDDSDKIAVAQLDRSGASDDLHPDNLPLRPDFGTQGREIVLRANYFPVHVRGTIYRYSAAIALTDVKLTRRTKYRVFKLAEQTEEWQQAGLAGHVAHDNAEKLVASKLLPQPFTISGTYYDEDENGPPSEGGKDYTLTLTFEEVDPQSLNKPLAKGLSALNLVLTANTSRPGIKIGRDNDEKKHPDQRFFFDAPDPQDIGGGLTAREGFYVSVRPAHQQLMVNVNTCHAAFYKPQNFVDAMDEYCRLTRSNRDTCDFGSFGAQVRVMTNYGSKNIVMIQSISNQSARQHKFKGPFGKVTIEEYYKRKWDVTLKHPNLRLLKGPNDSFYPPELCDIRPDQGFKDKLTNGKQAKAMLDVACKSPKENAEEIVHRGIGMLGFRDANPLLESFGVSVDPEMATVPGRVLEKPGVAYSSNKPADIDPVRGSWNLRDVKFAGGARLDRWAVLAIQDGRETDFGGAEDQQLRTIVDGFCRMCNKSGMQMRPLGQNAYATARLPVNRDDAIKEIKQALVRLMKQASPQLILVMLSDENEVIYNGLKRVCDVELDVATVCMQSDKVKRDKGQPQYFANVALKVNMKMGGINHKLDGNSGIWLKSASTMIMGMDVTHGKPASVLAVVASVDQYYAQYPAILALQKGNVEIERDESKTQLKNMFVSRFELFKARNNGKLPERVVLYRDGVSESQFVQVRKYELMQLKKAFEHFGPYQPKLSIIICGKRHHTRFYPTQHQDAANDGNPLPGTVVDRGVTPVHEFDFFLQAHAGLKGTARPTHYYVVHDENGFTADELQRMTNDLSYMFTRATKAVSLVSPAYWADIACERGRCYLHKLLKKHQDDGENKKGKKRTAEDDAAFEEAQRLWGNGVSGSNLRDTMFYL